MSAHLDDRDWSKLQNAANDPEHSRYLQQAAAQARCPDCGVLLWAGPKYPPHLPTCEWITRFYRDLENSR